MNEHAPGWYEHDGERRYWDGAQWTHSTSLPSSASPQGGSPQGSGQELLPPSTGSVPPPQASGPPQGYAAPPPGYVPPHQGHGPPHQGYAPPPHGGPPPVFAPPRKDPAVSLLVSFFVPGVGSMMNGDVGEGVAFLGAYALGLVLLACLGWLLVGFIGLPIMVGAWIWSMIHAYQGAQMYNRAVGYPE